MNTGNPDQEGLSQVLVVGKGTFPNNPLLPVVLYRDPLGIASNDAPETVATSFESVFERARWSGGWRNGVYPYHHFHSSAHEVLGCYGGIADIQLGGPGGAVLRVVTGDVVIIPAGVAHKRVDSSSGFRVVGAYPYGQTPDMCYGKEGEQNSAAANVSRVPLPELDPAYPTRGILLNLWSQNRIQ